MERTESGSISLSFLGRVQEIVRANGMVFVLIFLMIVMSFVSPKFLTPRNLLNVAVQNCVVTIVAMGVTYILISGGMDLSVGSVVGLVGVFTAGLVQLQGLSEPLALLITFVIAVFVGLFNGWMITRFRLDPIVVTLGTWYIGRGLVQNYVRNATPTAPPFTEFLGGGSIAGVPVILMITVALVIISHLVLTKTVLGRWAFAMGGNQVAARLSGVPINKARMIFFLLSAVYAYIAAILMTGRIYAVEASTGEGLVFAAPAAAIVGGTSLFGGRGSMINAVIGALIMGIIANGLNLTRVSFFWQQVAVGSAIILAVSVDALQRRRE